MATRCAIGFINDENKIIAKYSHYDGYPEYTGAMLNEFYSDDNRVKEMVMLGDQSVLMKEYIPTSDDHSFETPEKDVTVFYGRDRGETRVEPRGPFNDILEFVEHYLSAGCEYFYLWDGNEWLCQDRNNTRWECANPRKVAA